MSNQYDAKWLTDLGDATGYSTYHTKYDITNHKSTTLTLPYIKDKSLFRHFRFLSLDESQTWKERKYKTFINAKLPTKHCWDEGIVHDL